MRSCNGLRAQSSLEGLAQSETFIGGATLGLAHQLIIHVDGRSQT